jgi:DNA-binding SARP family transcriptional activator
VEILVLGPAAVKTDGRSLELRDRKGVGLLAYLATEGRTSRDKLADLLWTDMNQTDARRNLRQRLYELKGKLPDGCLNTDGDTVGLEPSAQTDLAQFRAHIANGEDEAAVTLWRGAFLHGLELPGADGFEEWLEPMREGLNTAYHEALRRLATAREERGDLRGALEAHQRLLEDDELQEHHQRETIRLLEALGERENALRQYESYRQTLEQELGDVPLPQTQQLAERVQHAIRRVTDAPTIAELDALSLELRSPLIGREAEWTRLERAPHGLSLIAGEPGIGKSRLADELAFYVARHGAVRRLQGREGSSGSPLYPVAESLRDALREPAWIETLEPVWRVECARLVPEIDPQAAPQPMPSLEGRVRFIEGLARALIASVSDGGGGVIVLDDLHWFDAATLELVGHLTRRARDANVRLIATARTEELECNEAAAPILADLKRDGLLARLDLEPLQERDVRSLIQSLSGGRDAPAFAKRLHSATVGNPFFLLETLRDLFGSGQLYVMADGTWATPYDDATENYAELPIPTTVRETVIARVDRTGADARRLLEAASLAGDGFDLALISSATALTEWEGVEAIERAVNAELLEPVNDGYRFNHDLIRRALEDGLNPDRRKLIHKKLAVSLETANAQPARIAEHYEQAGMASQAISWHISAAQIAIRLYALDSAYSHYRKALDAPEISVPMRADIHRRIGDLYRHDDDYGAASKELEYSIKIARECENKSIESLSLSSLSRVLMAQSDYNQAYQNANEAAFLARSANSIDAISAALCLRGEAKKALGDSYGAKNDFEEALSLLISLNRNDEIVGILYNLALLAVDQGDWIVAQDHFNQALEKAKIIGNPIWLARYLTGLGWLAFFKGNFKEAESYTLKSLDEFRSLNARWEIANTLANLGHIANHMDNTGQAFSYYHESVNIAIQINSVGTLLEILVGMADIEQKQARFENAARIIGLVMQNRSCDTEIRNLAKPVIRELKKHMVNRNLQKIIETESSYPIVQALEDLYLIKRRSEPSISEFVEI